MMTFRHVSRAMAVVAVVVVGLTAACIEPMGSQRATERTGFIFIRPVLKDTTGAMGVAIGGAVYAEDGLRYATFNTDTCVMASYTRRATYVLPLQSVAAGTEMWVGHARGQQYIPVRAVAGTFAYVDFLTTLPALENGDTVTVALPGENGSFPETTVRVRAAEAIKAITATPSGNEMDFTWTPPTLAGSRMEFSLYFTSVNTLDNPDVQVQCNVADDGVFKVPAIYGQYWAAANTRGWSAKRIRIASEQPDSYARLYVISEASFPLPMAADTL